ncbi:hypothetical protein Angca_001971 [Angiostrongylus cantonensis]|nr:hypothetical protein Angca_001985 [Angiostrongylus cantonensis]KAE9412560.1 hypothetical protein Angca_001971 [Angiostrongylus cantonensis]
MTFTYNNDMCRTTVVAVCSQSDPLLNQFAAIVANGEFFLDIAANSVSFPGTCNTTSQTW